MMAAEPSTNNSADVFASTEPQPVRRLFFLFKLQTTSHLCGGVGAGFVFWILLGLTTLCSADMLT